jgi:hypothetical protein
MSATDGTARRTDGTGRKGAAAPNPAGPGETRAVSPGETQAARRGETRAASPGETRAARPGGVRDAEPAGTAAKRRPARARPARAGVLGVVFGLAPHLLHHAGWIAGAAVIAGAGGTLIFAAAGLIAMVPMLMRLRRRFGWWGAGATLAAYAVMFGVSAALVGPALSGGPDRPAPAVSGTVTTGPYGHGHLGHR